jgi:hypothetical protein
MSAPCSNIDCTACQLDRCNAEIERCLATEGELAYSVAMGHADWHAEKLLIDAERTRQRERCVCGCAYPDHFGGKP